jgi:hypothetical protein
MRKPNEIFNRLVPLLIAFLIGRPRRAAHRAA